MIQMIIQHDHERTKTNNFELIKLNLRGVDSCLTLAKTVCKDKAALCVKKPYVKTGCV